MSNAQRTSQSGTLPPRRRKVGVPLLLTLALVYALLGALGVSFAIPPGYASPIFPAAGFAVAALLWSGRASWKAVWLGSFMMNVCNALLHGPLHMQTWLVACGIATGAALQAVLAWWLLQQFARGRWHAMESESDILLCLVLAGPLACFVSAGIGVATLGAAGLTATADTLYAAMNWWLGDVMGVWIMLPLSLAVLYRKDPLWRSRLMAQVLPMAVVLGLVGVVFYAVSDWEREQEELKLAKHGEALVQKVQQRFIAHQEALASLRRLLEVTPDMTYSRFEYFTRITLKDNPDIYALSINPYVTRDQRPAFESRMRKLMLDFRIRERDAQRQLITAQDRADYVPVGFIAPQQGNTAAIGFDINSEAVRANAISRARSTGSTALTAPVQLVQENKKRPGVLLMVPAYRMDNSELDHSGLPQLIGFSVGVIKVDELMEIATQTLAIQGLHVRLEDLQAPASSALLYANETNPHHTSHPSQWRGQIAVADRQWTLSLHATDAYIQQQRHWLALTVGGAGLLLAGMLQLLLMGTTGRTAVVQRIVNSQTAELQANSRALVDRNAQLNALFTLSPDGFVAIDHKGIVRFVNPAFQNITGIGAADSIGQTEDALHKNLQRRGHTPSVTPGALTSYRTFGDGLSATVLNLKVPRNKVVQMVSVQSESPEVARILYFRDVTVEAEVDQLKSEFLSTAAHELRTPLVSVYGFSEVLLSQEMGDADRKDLLAIIHRQAGQMAGILDDLLDLSRMEARRGKDFVFEKVPLQTLASQAVKGFAVPADRTLPEVDLPDATHTVLAACSQAVQAIRNVLANAYQYSPLGGKVRMDWVEAEAGVHPALIGLRITDHGIGMSEDQVKRLFERFYRADTSGKTPGTGLGMAIVKEIVELHAGRVDVESRPGEGTRVTLWFPLTLAS